MTKYIPGTLDLVYQGMLENIDTKEKAAHISYKDMEQLDFQMMLTDNYYVNPNTMHFCFPMKIKQLSNETNDIESDLITANNFFAHLIKEIGVTRYGNDKQLIPTFSPNEIYQYSDAMLKHLPKNPLKKIEKTMLYIKKLIFFNRTRLERRTHNSNTANDITEANDTEDLNIN